MKQMKLKLPLAVLVFCCAIGFNARAQETDSVEVKKPKEYVKQTFDHPQLFNHQTNEVLPKRSMQFRIQHRFGAVGVDESFYKQFLGLDLPANIRLGFSMAVTKNLMLGFGRTKIDKVWDFEAKYAILKQTTDNKIPLSFSIYGNLGINSDDAPKADNMLFFADSTTLFEPKFAHRITYDLHLILSRKFGKYASATIAPTFIYRNLSAPGTDNYTFALPLSARIRVSAKTFVVLEYAYVFNNRTKGFRDPISIGVEMSTLGHAFQVFVSSSDNLLGQDLYTTSSYDYTKGKFLFGFNITRKFWIKKKRKKKSKE